MAGFPAMIKRDSGKSMGARAQPIAPPPISKTSGSATEGLRNSSNSNISPLKKPFWKKLRPDFFFWGGGGTMLIAMNNKKETIKLGSLFPVKE